MKHLLIDFENIQPQNLDKLSEENTHIWIFFGVNHKTLPIDLVQSLLRFGDRVHFIRLQKMGKNALDFYLSYYLGQITTNDKNATIGILSKDGGYDVLVEHILENKLAVDIVRLSGLNDMEKRMEQSNLPNSKKTEPKSKKIEPKSAQPLKVEINKSNPLWQKISTHILSIADRNKPKKYSALVNAIKSQTKCDMEEAEEWVKFLTDEKIITTDGIKITYLK